MDAKGKAHKTETKPKNPRNGGNRVGKARYQKQQAPKDSGKSKPTANRDRSSPNLYPLWPR
ncbi:hypothetical protein CTA1_1865 [Colletotrichum tanaceti]|uniref:Uncharacterized protein n=1 Tax=Colletotrichum tanaceti TaxID=1306861 RepID=A0A4U6X3M5_9PEZI|nr:hypothetical protein CTA1_1865 [Colletotrichum tanaceti]